MTYTVRPQIPRIPTIIIKKIGDVSPVCTFPFRLLEVSFKLPELPELLFKLPVPEPVPVFPGLLPEGVAVGTGVDVGFGAGVTVDDGASVGFGVSIGTGVAVGSGVSVGFGVSVGTGVSVGLSGFSLPGTFTEWTVSTGSVLSASAVAAF